MEQEAKNKEMKECSFKPKTNSKGSSRTFNQFLENQQAHTQRVNSKNEELKKNIEDRKKKSNTYKP